MPALDLQQTLDARTAALLADGRTLEHSPRSTIEPAELRRDSRGVRALAALTAQGQAAAGLTVGPVLGEGGMGVVRLATQHSLGRDVAVKELHDHDADPDRILKLLREAWVMGALEHPSIVPIHDVVVDEHGRPRIVFKKVEGTAWSDLLEDRERVRAEQGATDVFEWHLRTFVQVANAIHFAHSRGILHRDIKPENVMVGRFGEVYVLDWGIAVSLRDDPSGRLPLARDASELCGTPCYMAPELLGGAGAHQSERTDVYLLGAVLHEITTGSPPHDGAAFPDIVQQIVASHPHIPAEVPEELAGILRRAMARDPARRHASADELRREVAAYLEHRGSLVLARQAEQRLDEVLAEVSSPAGDADERRLRTYHLFAECRFGFQQALRAWPDNLRAQRGLQRALTALIDLELSLGDARAAALLLTELPEPVPELSARVEAARRAREREDERLKALAQDHDPQVGRRTRVFLAALLGTLWTVAPLLRYLLQEQHGLSYGTMVRISLGMLLLAGGLGYWARESMTRTAFNRAISHTVAFALVGQVVLTGVLWLLDIPATAGPALLHVLWCALAAQLGMMLDRRLLPAAVGYAAGALVAAAFPAQGLLVMSATNLVLLVNMVLLWGRPREDVLAGLEQRRRERAQRWAEFLAKHRG